MKMGRLDKTVVSHGAASVAAVENPTKILGELVGEVDDLKQKVDWNLRVSKLEPARTDSNSIKGGGQ